jgi:hypothetical protein
VRIVKPTAWSVEREPAALVSSLLHRMSPNLAHLGDGSRPSWRPLIGVVLPALSRLGHKGRPVPRMAVGGNYPNRILAQSPARATRSGHDHGFVQAGGQADFLARLLALDPARSRGLPRLSEMPATNRTFSCLSNWWGSVDMARILPPL